MTSKSLAPDRWLFNVLLRYLGVYLISLAVLVRSADDFYGQAGWDLVLALTALYSVLLVAEPWLARQAFWYPRVYLLVQTGVVLGLLLIPPHPDYFALLFLVLVSQAMVFFGPREGRIWIGLFVLVMAGPLLAGPYGLFAGLARLLLSGVCCVLIGLYEQLFQNMDNARRKNGEMLQELHATHRQLQDYAAQVEELAAVEERRRMARELHDSATQTIFSMNLTVQTARLLIKQEPARVVEQLDRLQELAHSAAGEIQMLTSQLRPRSLAEEELPAALRRLAADRQARDDLHIQLEISGDKVLAESVGVGLQRIVQEALNNVAKHAGTHEAVVRLNLAGARAFLEVEDRGVGFDPGAIIDRRGHVGLTGMAERARQIGWQFCCDSQPGRGTRIRVEEE